ncbi:MAG: STAS domain-containing protein [Nocardioidaceae bacterium]|nr:STAS domain-containing protein [Nocardioidaceae bacterium]NUS51489.1 STAS domain-containing protein [Nocardioidaceae bacterium]
MLLRLDVEDRDGTALITATGEIDAATADSLSTAVTGALEDGSPRVLVDFAQVTFIDSTGLGVLVKAHRGAGEKGAIFGVVHPTPQTLKLIRVLGLDLLLNIYDSPEQALAEPS